MNVRDPRGRAISHTRIKWQSRDAVGLLPHLASFFIASWNGRLRSVIADVGACACARLAWNRESSSLLQDSEYSKENANTAWKFGQGESRVSIRVRAYVCAHAYTLRDRHPPHLFVFRSRMPVRKLRRLRRNPRRRHRDFRHRLRHPLRSPSPTRLLRPRSDDWCSRSVGWRRTRRRSRRYTTTWSRTTRGCLCPIATTLYGTFTSRAFRKKTAAFICVKSIRIPWRVRYISH